MPYAVAPRYHQEMHNYKELKAWKASRVLCKNLYLITSSFPKEEKFGLTGQIRRSAISVPSNIAEGASRTSNKEYARFLEIAIGSLYELETQLLIAKDLEYLSENLNWQLISDLNEIIKMTAKFRSKLLRS